MTHRRRWRGPDDPDEMSSSPRPLGDTLAEVAGALRLDDPRLLGKVVSAWPGIVGDMVAAHTRPRALREGVLSIEVDSPEWATQLRYLEDELLLRLGREVGPRRVTGTKVVVRRS